MTIQFVDKLWNVALMKDDRMRHIVNQGACFVNAMQTMASCIANPHDKFMWKLSITQIIQPTFVESGEKVLKFG
jgi:uracil DNA glycosylase